MANLVRIKRQYELNFKTTIKEEHEFKNKMINKADKLSIKQEDKDELHSNIILNEEETTNKANVELQKDAIINEDLDPEERIFCEAFLNPADYNSFNKAIQHESSYKLNSLKTSIALKKGENIISVKKNSLKCGKHNLELNSSETPFIKKKCGLSFERKHITITQPIVYVEKKVYKCDKCRNCFANLAKHSCAKHLKCPKCEKTFAYKSHLMNHKVIAHRHVEVKLFECIICQKNFKFKKDLKIHHRSHKPEKPFKCGVCQKNFMSIEYLKIHERLHTGERPFECNLCGRRFTRRSSLRCHEVVHTKIDI